MWSSVRLELDTNTGDGSVRARASVCVTACTRTHTGARGRFNVPATTRVPCSTLPLTLYYYRSNGVSDLSNAFFIYKNSPYFSLNRYSLNFRFVREMSLVNFFGLQ